MKYTNILAGVFGLMALAACSNNDEVVVEQPKEVHTITVAYGRGANTRLQTEEDWKDYGEFSHLAFKSSWENTDKIKLVAESGTEYEYSIETINADGTATFTREGEALEDGTYKVVYPASWNGSLRNYGFQSKTSIGTTFKDYLFDIKDYQYAMAIAECTGGKFAEIALKPIFNFLYIPEDLEITNMELYDWSKIGNGCTKVIDGKTIFDTVIELKGTNLYKTINNFAGGNKGSLFISDSNEYESWPVFYNSESKKWQFEYGTLVAFPVLPDQEPVTDLQLWFYEIPCYLLDASSSNKTEFYEGGHVYNLEGFNLVFPVPEVEPEVGRIIGSDGKYYKTTADVPTGVTPEAMVGKWNTGDGYGFGISLEDASKEPLTPEEAYGYIYNDDEAWCKAHTIGGYYDDWGPLQCSTLIEIFKDCGSTSSGGFNYEEELEFDYGNFRDLLKAVGTDVKDGIYFCEWKNSHYWGYDFANKKFVKLEEGSEVYLRPRWRIQ